MFLSRNKKNNVYPCKPRFYYIKVGFKGVSIIKACFRDDWILSSIVITLLKRDRGVARNFTKMKPPKRIFEISAEAQPFLQDCMCAQRS